MSWPYVFPAFASILNLASRPSGFTFLIYLSFLLTLAVIVAAVTFIGHEGHGLYRNRPLPFFVTTLGCAAIIVYYSLFTPLDWFAVNGLQMSYLLSGSPALFGLFYCVGFPLFVGLALGLAAKSAIALAGKLFSPSTNANQSRS